MTHDLGQTATSDGNLLSGLTSLARLSVRDQRILEQRLRLHSAEAKFGGSIWLAASLLRASYELPLRGQGDD